MNYIMFKHNGKGDAYEKALNVRHHQLRNLRPLYPNVDFVFTDQAIYGRVEKLAYMRRHGVKRFFVYPHSARPNLINDIEPLWYHTSAEFVSAPGHVEIMRRYGHNRPIHVVGWSLCEMLPFRARARVRKVLFAPIHPRCDRIDQEYNWNVYKILEKLADDDLIKLTVRYIKSLPESGLRDANKDHPNIRYVEGHLMPSTYQIDDTDVVVGHQTFAYIAIARGVPTIMFGEDLPTHLVPRKRPPQFARNWSKYHDLLRYPHDIMDSNDPLRMMQLVSLSDQTIKEWRERMIGEPFKPKEFLDIVESYF